MEFNAESSTVFCGLTEVQDVVSAGLNYSQKVLEISMVHLIPQVREWTKTIQTGMKKREEDAKQLRKKL
ncbi:TPA: hypothetical protein ACGL4W_001232 [Streptococcus agalactiae]